MIDHPVFSPSQTALYFECPRKWWLQRVLGIQPRYFGYSELAMINGIAFAKFFEKFGLGYSVADATTYAVSCMYQELERMSSTRTLVAACEPTYDNMEVRLHDLIQAYIDGREGDDPNPNPAWELFDYEREFTEHGRARVDSLYRTGAGKLGVLDMKTKTKIEARSIEKIRREYERSWQLRHYAWMVRDTFNEPVEQLSIIVVTTQPRRFTLGFNFAIDQSEIDAWVATAKRVWQDMQDCLDGKRLAHGVDIHVDDWGKECQFIETCFGYQGSGDINLVTLNTKGSTPDTTPDITSENAWLAGLLDGEGFFFTAIVRGPYGRKTYYYPAIRIEMSDHDIIDRVGKLWNVKIFKPKRKTKKSKQIYRVTIKGSKAKSIMTTIQPWLSKRRKEKIDEVLHFCETEKLKATEKLSGRSE